MVCMCVSELVSPLEAIHGVILAHKKDLHLSFGFQPISITTARAGENEMKAQGYSYFQCT